MIQNRMFKKTYPANAVRICIDRLCQSDLEGRMYSKLQAEPILFQNCVEMFLKADKLFDQKGFPQTFQQKRTFSKDYTYGSYCAVPSEELDDAYILGQKGRRATLDVLVQTRQKAGWQGVLICMDGRNREFKSEIELLACILEALTASGIQKDQ